MASTAIEPRLAEVEANGIRFATLEWGEEGSPLALLIHGYPDTAWTWRFLGPYLAASGFQVVAPFTRGYGPSGFAPDGRYLVEEMKDDILSIEEKLRGDGPSVLVGHDWGALITWAISSDNPDRFSRIVAMAVPPPATLLVPWGSLGTVPTGLSQLRASWYFFFNQLPGSEHTLTRLIPRLWKTWSPDYDARQDLGLLFSSLDSLPRLEAALAYYRHNLRPAGFRYLHGLKPSQPALYLHGHRDGCVREEIARLAGPLLPEGSRLEVVDGVGHFMQLEDPKRVNSLIGEWLGTRPGESPEPESL